MVTDVIIGCGVTVIVADFFPSSILAKFLVLLSLVTTALGH